MRSTRTAIVESHTEIERLRRIRPVLGIVPLTDGEIYRHKRESRQASAYVLILILGAGALLQGALWAVGY